MSGKFVLKFAIAFGMLAALLVFLGVNYVPRISALSSTSGEFGGCCQICRFGLC